MDQQKRVSFVKKKFDRKTFDRHPIAEHAFQGSFSQRQKKMYPRSRM
jgi:hypothetical protein